MGKIGSQLIELDPQEIIDNIDYISIKTHDEKYLIFYSRAIINQRMKQLMFNYNGWNKDGSRWRALYVINPLGLFKSKTTGDFMLYAKIIYVTYTIRKKREENRPRGNKPPNVMFNITNMESLIWVKRVGLDTSRVWVPILRLIE